MRSLVKSGERGGGEGMALIPLLGLSECQAAFNLSRCASLRIAMFR